MLSGEPFGPQSSLDRFFESVFVVETAPAPSYAYQFRKTLKWLRRVLRRAPRLSDLRQETWAMCQKAFEEMGASRVYARSLGTRLITLWKFAAAKGVASECLLKAPYRRRPGPDRVALPEGEPGTLLAFFWERYLPEVLNGSNEFHVRNYWMMFRDMRECFGDDVRLEALNATLLSAFVAFMTKRGLKSSTLVKRRGLVLCLWRYAHSENLAPAVPVVRSIKIERETPDAWSLAEFKRIVAASLRLEKPDIGGVPANLFWHALLLTAYYTALRRGTLFELRLSDFDLETGWLSVPGSMMKNRVGQKFRLGDDAIAALRKIWTPTRDRAFPAPRGSGNLKHLSNHFREILKTAIVESSPRKCFSQMHKIRRTAVTLTAANAGLAQAMAIAGHSGPAVTARYIDPRFLPQNDATQWLPSPTGEDK